MVNTIDGSIWGEEAGESMWFWGQHKNQSEFHASQGYTVRTWLKRKLKNKTTQNKKAKQQQQNKKKSKSLKTPTISKREPSFSNYK